MRILLKTLFLVITLTFLSCGSGDDNSLMAISQDEQINSYIAQSSFSFQKTSSGLQYAIESEGEGPMIVTTDIVALNARGFFLDNRTFLNNFGGAPINLNMSDPLLIPGLKEGLQFLNKGARATFLMPSRIAFGASGDQLVPPDTPVGYDVLIDDIINPEAKLQENIVEIEKYLEDNNITTARKTESNLYYVIETPGDGDRPFSNSTVTVHYKGYLTDGTVFDSSIDREEPSTFSLEAVIPAWQEGIPLFSRGAIGKLFVPSTLAYGGNPPTGSGIPPYGVIIFDIELINF